MLKNQGLSIRHRAGNRSENRQSRQGRGPWRRPSPQRRHPLRSIASRARNGLSRRVAPRPAIVGALGAVPGPKVRSGAGRRCSSRARRSWRDRDRRQLGSIRHSYGFAWAVPCGASVPCWTRNYIHRCPSAWIHDSIGDVRSGQRFCPKPGSPRPTRRSTATMRRSAAASRSLRASMYSGDSYSAEPCLRSLRTSDKDDPRRRQSPRAPWLSRLAPTNASRDETARPRRQSSQAQRPGSALRSARIVPHFVSPSRRQALCKGCPAQRALREYGT